MPYYPPASSGSGISDIVEDTTPQLGGNLDTNGFNIQVSGDNGVLALTSDTDGGDYNIAANTTGVLAIYGSAGETLNVSLLDGYLELGAQTASTVPYLDANKRLVSSDVTPTELDYLDGVTSAIQTQLDAKQPLDSDLTTIAGLTATTDNFIQSKSSAWASRTPAQVASDLAVEVGKLLMPVGFIFISDSSTNPGTSLGFGTWTRIEGRFIVGVSDSDGDFDVDDTGGAKTHTHSLSDDGYALIGGTAGIIRNRRMTVPSYNSTVQYTATVGANTDAQTLGTELAGATDSGSSLPPYIAKYVFERTA